MKRHDAHRVRHRVVQLAGGSMPLREDGLLGRGLALGDELFREPGEARGSLSLGTEQPTGSPGCVASPPGNDDIPRRGRGYIEYTPNDRTLPSYAGRYREKLNAAVLD